MYKFCRSLIVILLVFSAFSQCSKEISNNSGITEVVTPEPVTAHLQGNIVDENDQPATGVTVTVGSKSVVTDASGYFRILDASLDKKTALVTAVKAGYFKGFRVFCATTGTNQVAIKLIKKSLAGSVDASSGGDVSLSNGAKILFPANGIVLASGGNYSGAVNVYAKYIDPTAPDISETVPGSFAANDKNGKRVLLSSYGMMAVELESASGEKLQIKEGAVATLTMPIPSAILSSAPATIAMWSIDEQTGLWREEGTGTRQGNNYVGDVKHFSFWNCDRPFNAVFLSMTLKTAIGELLTHVTVKITSSNNGSASGITDSLGQLGGLVPANESLTLEILNQCNEVIYSQTISPLSQDTDIGTITATSPPLFTTLKGRLLDCNGLPVANGHVIFSVNNWVRIIRVNSNGEFTSDPFSACPGSSYKLIGVDETSQQQSSIIPVSITSTITNIGNINTCQNSTIEFINYTVDGTNYSLRTDLPNNSIYAYYKYDNSTPSIQAIIGSNYVSDSIHLTFPPVSVTGVYDVKYITAGSFYNATAVPPFTITFTKIASIIGDFYEGSFAGNFKGNNQTTHTINGTFKIRKDQ